MEDLIKILPNILRTTGEAEEVAEAAAMVAWRRIAGEGLRAHAVPFRLYRKTLVVAVTDKTWQKQLEAMSSQLIFQINSVLGQALVTYIEFRIDPQTVQNKRGIQRQPVVVKEEQEERALKRITTDLNSAALAIQDEDLRHRFLVAAGCYIDRQQQMEENSRYQNRS
jgi:hypothetical protein